MYTLKQIATITGGKATGVGDNRVRYLSTDSRKIFFPAETLFFAIATERRDGHDFLKDAYEQGVRSFVIARLFPSFTGNNPGAVSAWSGAGAIIVPDTLHALQAVATFHRLQFDIPVVGITGSNGKTIVKEWLQQLLNQDFKIVRSPRSYNSQIGVALSVWQMNASHTMGIFEAGISRPGEMPALERMIRPTIGVLTNIGAAHDEAFTDRRDKLYEKLRLFSGIQQLVCCTDDPLIREAIVSLDLPAFTWGNHPDALVSVGKIIKSESNSNISLVWKKVETALTIPFTDDASIENAIHCFCTCCLLGLPADIISSRMATLHPVEMRLEWKKAINNCYLINDSYSNDLSSLIIALDYLKQQRESTRETVILSDIYQSGMEEAALYEQVAGLLSQYKVARVICVGPAISLHKEVFMGKGMRTSDFASTEAFIRQFDILQFRDEAILLKGSRIFGFEKIAALLEQQVHQTVLEINLTAVANNLRVYRSMLQPGTKMMVMVKAFGYGSGGSEIAKVLQFNKADYLGVAYADEGVELRQAGIHLPIMVMNAEPATFDALEDYNLQPEIYSFDILHAFYHFCETRGIASFPIHIKFDTGMHRLGFEVQEAARLASFLSSQEILKVVSVFTHLVASEDARQDAFTQQQALHFEEACDELQKVLSAPFIRHAANSSAISRHPLLQLDMVRLGIGLYGIGQPAQLEIATSLKSTVAQVKNVPKGDTVGYNRRGMVYRDSLIATVRIGYADGYRREMSNGTGFMYLQGQRAPVIGSVCMDMTMIDVTDLPLVKAGDEVEIFGKNIPIQELAKQCNTIPYEIMTGISQRVKRVYFEE